jgi:hypothetical protein
VCRARDCARPRTRDVAILDLALAHALRALLDDAGQSVDEWQFLALVQAAREAKEALFNDPALASVPVAVPTILLAMVPAIIAPSITVRV